MGVFGQFYQLDSKILEKIYSLLTKNGKAVFTIKIKEQSDNEVLALSDEKVKISLQNLNVYSGRDMMMICLSNKVSRSGSHSAARYRIFSHYLCFIVKEHDVQVIGELWHGAQHKGHCRYHHHGH